MSGQDFVLIPRGFYPTQRDEGTTRLEARGSRRATAHSQGKARCLRHAAAGASDGDRVSPGRGGGCRGERGGAARGTARTGERRGDTGGQPRGGEGDGLCGAGDERSAS